ncbi:hypothetical protein ABZ370_30885 [Streptomyces sp. NPDC005962]
MAAPSTVRIREPPFAFIAKVKDFAEVARLVLDEEGTDPASRAS